MRIVISNDAGTPLYEQVASQVRDAILAGEVAEGDVLPSIRSLARDLRISVITTTRAYAELEAEGFISNVQGKGAYVQAVNSPLIQEQLLRRVEEGLSAAIEAAALAQMTSGALRDTFDMMVAGSLLRSEYSSGTTAGGRS